MKYQLVLFDVDSTLIEQEVIDLLGNYSGQGQQIAEITAQAMQGDLDFDQALSKRVGLLEGLPESIILDVVEEISFSPGALQLLGSLKDAGCKVGVVSGGFHNILDRLFTNLELDFLRATTLEVVEGTLTGKTVGPVINRQAKAVALKEFAQMYGIALEKTVAVGDGSNDLEMIQVAGLGISYRGKPILNAAADVVISEPNLMQVLEFLV